MALKLLRGTTAQRTGYTPEVGEPVWDTDESKLYVGDGATVGGIAIDVANATLSLDNLTDVDITAPVTTGHSLVYNGSEFAPGDATILSNKSLGDLSNVDITTSAPTTGQVLKWNGSAFVPGDDNSVAGTGLVSGATYDISIAGSVYTSDEVTLLVDGVAGKITGDVHSSVYSTDGNTLLVDATNSKITGDLQASVYSADGNEVLMIDGPNGRITGDINNNIIENVFLQSTTVVLSGVDSNTNAASITMSSDTDGDRMYIRGYSDTLDGQNFVFERSRGSEATPAALQSQDDVATLSFFGADSEANQAFVSGIIGRVAGTPGAGTVPGSIVVAVSDGVGGAEEALIVSSNGLAVSDNTVTANSGSGSADVAGGVATYLKINVGGVDYAMPLYGIVA